MVTKVQSHVKETYVSNKAFEANYPPGGPKWPPSFGTSLPLIHPIQYRQCLSPAAHDLGIVPQRDIVTCLHWVIRFDC